MASPNRDSLVESAAQGPGLLAASGAFCATYLGGA